MFKPYVSGLGLLLSATAILVGCGGGGGTSSPAPAPVQQNYALATAMVNWINLNKTSAIQLSGNASNGSQTYAVTGSGTITEATFASTFEGSSALAKRMTTAMTVQLAGASQATNGVDLVYFDPATYKYLGAQSAGNAYCVANTASSLPNTVAVGATGTWYTNTCYTTAAKTTKIGTSTVSYIIEPESDTTAIISITTTVVPPSGAPTVSNDRVRITPTGTITKLSGTATTSINGVTMNLALTYS